MNRLASCSILALGALLLSACTTVDYDFSDVAIRGNQAQGYALAQAVLASCDPVGEIGPASPAG